MNARGQGTAAESLARKYYKGYHLLRVSERDADTRAFLSKQSNGSNPSVVHADFDGDGHLDYAMLHKNDTSAAAKLVILLCDTPTLCHSVHELNITGYPEGAYLLRLPVGSRVVEAEADEEEKPSRPRRLATAGIQLVYFEKASVTLYWDKKLGKIIEVGTSD